jgi:branched-chain amino acid transport system ATP-binding protein
MAPLLEVENLRAGYGLIEAVKSVALRVEPGEIVALIGANGAGKTTLLMTISGCIAARGGRVRFDGREITALAAHEIVRAGLCQSPEGRKIFPRLSIMENLALGAYTRRDKQAVRDDTERVLELFPILRQRSTQLGGTLSGGEQQMLAVARALMGRPKLLLLDEPSLGLAPLVVLKIFEVLAELNRQGMAILLVEQNARLALRLAQRGYVMETGSITISDSAATLLSDPRVQQAYLGE